MATVVAMATDQTSRMETNVPPSVLEIAHATAAAAAAARAPTLAELSRLQEEEKKTVEEIPDIFVLPTRLQEDDGEDETVPVIDFGILSGKDDDEGRRKADRIALGNQIVAACEKWGFFQVVNYHGLSPETVKAARVQAVKVFEVPSEVKMKSARNLTTKHSGYGTAAFTATSGTEPWSEAFTIMGNPHPNPSECALTLWEGDSQAAQRAMFTDAINNFIDGLHKLGVLLMELLLEGYGIDKEHFEGAFLKDPQETLRLNKYPPCPDPSRAVGLDTHVDSNVFTILHDGGVAGLQLKTDDGRYVAIAPREDGFAVNVGDMLQLLTYGRCKSVLHRVVVNKDTSRLSFAFFVSPSLTSKMSPHPMLIDGSQPNYENKEFTWADYYIARRILCTSKSLDGFLVGDKACDMKGAVSAY